MTEQQKKEKLRKRAKLVEQSRSIQEKAQQEKRDVTVEEMTECKNLLAEAQRIWDEVDLANRQDDVERSLDESLNPVSQPGETREQGPITERRYRDLLQRFSSNGPEALQPAEREALRTEAFIRYLRYGNQELEVSERRALQADNGTSGGNLVPPMVWISALIKAMDNVTFVRRVATVISNPSADSLGCPSLDTDVADPTWTSELKIGAEDSSMELGRRELHPHPLAKYIKVSRKLLRLVPNVEQLVMQRLAYKQGIAQENGFLNGSGSAQPLGIFTANENGISTSRDVSTGNTATSVTFDGLKKAKWTLKQGYHRTAQWVFHRDFASQIDILKDGEGRYIWQPSVVVGEPDRVLNFPVNISEYAPHTFTASQYVAVLGDFSYYWIADALLQEIQRLEELYAGTNQMGIIIRSETDGMPVQQEAFVRVKLAA